MGVGARERFRAAMARALGTAGLEVAAAVEDLVGCPGERPRAKRLPLDATPVSEADVAKARGSVTRLAARRARKAGAA